MKKIYTAYSEETDMTFILEDEIMFDECISTEVKGVYWGKPDEEATRKHYGKLRAVYEL